MRLKFAQVQQNITEIANRENYDRNVLFELMAAYGRSASSITKLRKGVINLAEDKENEVFQRRVVYFKHVPDAKSLPAEVEKLEQNPLTARYNPRFVIATDYKYFAAKDTKKGTTLEEKWEDIDRHVDFFYGWTGDEVTDEKTEAAADRRAADKMKELYDEVENINKDKFAVEKNTFRHDLNVFFSRLLFCFFAEDTRVFTKDDSNLFTDAIKDYTQTDGSDLDEFLETLFEALDREDKSGFTSPFSKFPYVNGRLFDTKHGISIPKFNAQARKLILDCGSLSWAEINPDIFGSMFQGIVDEDERAAHGMHYTSVPNIMKTIEPLFMDELRDEFDKYYDKPKKLKELHDRIANVKIFDPACGSGNFLIIAYKELRKLEHAILERSFENNTPFKITSRINLNNFYGIEIDDFACELAVLSLYLAKHQMNIDFEKQFGREIKLIPLTDRANIVRGNAARIDWQKVCPNKPRVRRKTLDKQGQLLPEEKKQLELISEGALQQEEWDEIYLISNPPYLGSRNQSEGHKEDLKLVTKNYKSLDYIAIWFVKGADYIRGTKARLAFVSTNSITQGEQVAILWPTILDGQVEIGIAFHSFKWSNQARKKAGVTCVIIGLQNSNSTEKKLIDALNISHKVGHINPYLSPSATVYIHRRSKPLNWQLPQITFGSMPNDKGNLILNEEEKDDLIRKYPEARVYIKKFIGASELLRGLKRYCLFISNSDLENAIKIPEIKKRLEAVTAHRQDSSEVSTRDIADKPHRFYFLAHKEGPSIMIPRTTSERRKYIPAAILDEQTIVSDAAQVIYSVDPWVFALISSQMHMTWVCAVAGRLKTDYRYSSAIVYNNFPVKPLTEEQKGELNNTAREILFTRENHSEKTLGQMYDPDKMPDDLREAHHKNDLAVDRLYRLKPYNNDEERLADLFALYEEMNNQEK